MSGYSLTYCYVFIVLFRNLLQALIFKLSINFNNLSLDLKTSKFISQSGQHIDRYSILSFNLFSKMSGGYSELDMLYSPTRWSKKRENVVEKHMAFAYKETEKNRKNIPCHLNFPYGDKERQKIDIYGTDLPDDAPLFIYIHGGYWQALSKDDSGYVVAPFYKNKIKTMVIGYTLCPEVSVDDVVAEVTAAVKKCVDYAKQHGSKAIYISGYSAGSQLISSLFATLFPKLTKEEKSLFKAAVLCCGIYDLTPLVNTYVNDPLKLNLESAKRLSPMFHNIEKLNMKIYVACGDQDSPAFLKQSQQYFDKIKTLSDARFKIIVGEDHASIVEQYSNVNFELVRFILDINDNINKKV